MFIFLKVTSVEIALLIVLKLCKTLKFLQVAVLVMVKLSVESIVVEILKLRLLTS